METRKVQMTGGSSYVVTLPKEWVKGSKIKKNDPVGVIVQADGTLLVTPKTTEEKIQRTKEIDVDEIEDISYLLRLLIGAYMMGYSTIILKSKTRIPPTARDCIVDLTRTAIGPEIIEETTQSITTKDLLNPMEMSFDATIRRMMILVTTMHEDAITAMNTGNKSLIEDVVARDSSVDRLYWLVSRQFNMVLRDITLSKKMGVTQEEATFYYLIGRLMERAADHAVRIAENARVLMGKGFSPKLLKSISSASGIALKIFSRSMDSWFDKDINAASKNIDTVAELVSLCESINRTALTLDSKSSVALGYISESLTRTGEYAVNISELVINYLV